MIRAELEVSLLRPDPAIGPQPIVGAGSTGELEQLADDAAADYDHAANQVLGLAIAIAHHQARQARHAADSLVETPCP